MSKYSKLVQVWVTDEIHDALKAEAELRLIPVPILVRAMFRRAMEREWGKPMPDGLPTADAVQKP